MRYEIFIPGGNPTALVRDENYTPKEKIEINDTIMKSYPFVEQVGFIDDKFSLTMAGGETCVNALRCAAYVYMRDGNLSSVEVSMGDEVYSCGKDENGVYISSKFSSKFSHSLLRDEQILVNLGEISHIVSFQNLEFKSSDEFKEFAFYTLKSEGITKNRACGFMLYGKDGLKPVVYVRDVDTLFYESACGSGSLATSIALNLKGDEQKSYKIKQPSGKFLVVEISKNGDKFINFKISGEVDVWENL